MLTGQEKINLILDHLSIKAPSLARNIGVTYNRIQDIQFGRVQKLSSAIIDKIVLRYPQFNIDWLLRSEGDMVLPEENISPTTEKLISMLAESIKQNERLIKLLEKQLKDKQ